MNYTLSILIRQYSDKFNNLKRISHIPNQSKGNENYMQIERFHPPGMNWLEKSTIYLPVIYLPVLRDKDSIMPLQINEFRLNRVRTIIKQTHWSSKRDTKIIY